jgi:hypothetical protein
MVKDADNIRLGVIGMTEGNGHPYSWSAILNGYDRARMTADLEQFQRWVADGAAIMSSSSTRYAAEYAPYQAPNAPLGAWRFIAMPMAKKWETYGIHALEAVFSITGPGYVSVRNTGTAAR